MRLKQFLKEANVADIDISKFTNDPRFDPKAVESIKTLLSKFKQYSKITLNDVSEDDMFLHISNGLVDFDFSFGKDEQQGHRYPVIEISAAVNHELIFGHENLDQSETHRISLTGNSYEREFAFLGLSESRLFTFIDDILKVAGEFADWYFEITGNVGTKVKLVKVAVDLETGTSNSTWKWTPYIGQFFVENTSTTARVA